MSRVIADWFVFLRQGERHGAAGRHQSFESFFARQIQQNAREANVVFDNQHVPIAGLMSLRSSRIAADSLDSNVIASLSKDSTGVQAASVSLVATRVRFCVGGRGCARRAHSCEADKR